MLTLFTTTKPFQGHFGIIQRNAIQSWLHLRPACKIILFGKDDGAAELVTEFGISHIPEVACNEFGTPLVNSMFKIAQNISSDRLMAYVNADIILMSDFIDAVYRIQKLSFLMVGQRYDLEINSRLDFNNPEWELQLRFSAVNRGILHAKTGIDYFVFNRNLFKDIPPFAVGRPAWDNWLIYSARSTGVPVIDATRVITAIHQNHDYSHCLGKEEGAWKGPEAKHNLVLAGGIQYLFGLTDVTYILTKNGLKLALDLVHIWWRFYRLSVFYQFLAPLGWLLSTLLKISRQIMKKFDLTFSK